MNRVCPLCRSERLKKLFEKTEIPYFRCVSCDFVFSKPTSNANFENTIGDYEQTYIEYFEEGPEDRRNFASCLNWISGFQPLGDARLLDVGTGSGKLVRYLRSRSINAIGLEPSRAIFDHFLKRDDFLVNQTIGEFCSKSRIESFEVVTAFDVIEHVEAPDRFLERISRLLRPGGFLFISAPDGGSLTARLLGRRWHHYHRYHLSYLSRRTLVPLAERYELDLAEYSYRRRYFSMRYVLGYFCEFALRGNRPDVIERLPELILPLNLFDVMYLCFRKRSA